MKPLTEAEAWLAIGDWYGALGGRFPHNASIFIHDGRIYRQSPLLAWGGLCSWMYYLRIIGVVASGTGIMMHERAQLYRPKGRVGFWWTPGHIVPRVRFCYRMAELARREAEGEG